MKNYPSFDLQNLEDVIELLRYAIKERRNDVNDWNRLDSVFMSGRKVGKVPAGSGDVSPDDRVGDFNYDADYLYLLVDDGGIGSWRRVGLSSW